MADADGAAHGYVTVAFEQRHQSGDLLITSSCPVSRPSEHRVANLPPSPAVVSVANRAGE